MVGRGQGERKVREKRGGRGRRASKEREWRVCEGRGVFPRIPTPLLDLPVAGEHMAEFSAARSLPVVRRVAAGFGVRW